MITLPSNSPAHQVAIEIATCANNFATALANLRKGTATATTAEIEQELGAAGTAQIETVLAAIAQTDPAKHATAQAALK